MKSRLALSFGLVIFLYTVIFFACKKDQIERLDPYAGLSPEATKAAKWYDEQIKGISTEFVHQNRPEWDKMISDTINGSTLLAVKLYQADDINRELNLNIIDGEYFGAIKEYNAQNSDTLFLKVMSLTGRFIEEGFFNGEGKYRRTKKAFGNTVTLMGIELSTVTITGIRPMSGFPGFVIPVGPRFPFGGGGGGGAPPPPPKPKNFGIDPKCNNCQIKLADFKAFLDYVKEKYGLTAVELQNTTFTLSDGTKFQANITELRNSSGVLISSYINPINAINGLIPDLQYSSGNKGADGMQNPGVPPQTFTGSDGLPFSFDIPQGGGGTYNSNYSRVLDYIRTNGESFQSNLDFAAWADQYLKDNSDVSFDEFKNGFLNFKADGIDGPNDFDANYWNNPNLTITTQTLPSFTEFSFAYPKTGFGTLEFEMDAPSVFNLVGGTPQALRDASLTDNNPKNDNAYSNACALRVSRALNYSGVTIPEVSGTYKGADGKNYFLSAASLNAWMMKAFPPTTDNSVQLTGSDAGKNGVGFAKALKGLKGIYILIPNYPGIGYFEASGHAGLHTTPPVTHYYFTAKGGVSKITLWKLK